ncbi:MAG: YbaN family protein [Thioclava sp.]|nr:YbaN family protein [Thioclava sp.]MBD3801956.1 YbaN family protein [Thioclava sp.]
MRILWLILGMVSFAIGVIGIFLPLLPTVPLMLLAAFFFGKSSERLHQWLITHPRFGPSIQDWQERRAISKRAKIAASISIAAAFAVSVVIGLKPMLLAIQAATLIAVSIYIWTRPNS